MLMGNDPSTDIAQVLATAAIGDVTAAVPGLNHFGNTINAVVGLLWPQDGGTSSDMIFAQINAALQTLAEGLLNAVDVRPPPTPPLCCVACPPNMFCLLQYSRLK